MNRHAVLWVLLAGGTGTACALPNENAVIALHGQAPATKSVNVCPSGPSPVDPVSAGIPCSQYTSDNQPLMTARHVYLVAARGDSAEGFGGLSCGIAYGPNLTISGHTLCADLEFPNSGFPQDGGGNRVIWNASTNCQRTVIPPDGVHAVALAMYVYAYGPEALTVTPNLGLVCISDYRVANCEFAETDLPWNDRWTLGFGVAGIGYCDDEAVSARDVSWGKLRSMVRSAGAEP